MKDNPQSPSGDPLWIELRAEWTAFLAKMTHGWACARPPLYGSIELDREGVVTEYNPAHDAHASPHEIVGRDYFAEFAPPEVQGFFAELSGFLDGARLSPRFEASTGRITFLCVNKECA
ncbi:MAG TPA: hypothetical protein VF525_03215, partial [Pyrinomonadaceae bacterium]